MDTAKLDRTWLCTVLFMDIVGYSNKSVQLQAKLKERFTGYLSEAIRDVAENDRIVLDTGDGAAVCFLGAPEAAMFTGLKLRHCFLEDAATHEIGLKVRMGINLGPVKLVRDINDNLNAIGDGINTGQRVMSFAGENQVLVSRSFFEVVSCLSEDYEKLFQYEGAKKDKHVREHLVYRLTPSGQESGDSAISHSPLSTVGTEAGRFDGELLASLGALLAPMVGPIAGHLVKQAAEQAKDGGELIAQLSAQVSHPEDRAKFAVQAGHLAGVTLASSVTPGSQEAANWDADWLERARKELIGYVGPMARMLVDRAAKRAHTKKELCETLCIELPAAKREGFLKALGN